MFKKTTQFDKYLRFLLLDQFKYKVLWGSYTVFKEYEKECEDAKKICYFNFYKYDKETRERMYYDAKFLPSGISDNIKDYVIQEISNILTSEKVIEIKEDIIRYALFNLYASTLERFSRYVSSTPGMVTDATFAIQDTAYKYDYKKELDVFGFGLFDFGERVLYDLYPLTKENYFWHYIKQMYGEEVFSKTNASFLITEYTGKDLSFLEKDYSEFSLDKKLVNEKKLLD